MRSAHRPSSSIERILVLVLIGFIAIDLLLVIPAYASELRLDRLHPSLPVVNLRPLAAGRARITKALEEDFTAPIRALAGSLRQGGIKALNGAPASPTADYLETAVVQTATALALPPSTQIPAATLTQIESYTPSSTAALFHQEPSMTPSQVAIVTATAICTALPAAACQALPTPTSTPTAVPSSTPVPTQTQTIFPAPTPSGSVPAFPGAQGWGAGSIGGRGGRVIEVFNLNDSGPGSLRAAIEARGPRIVVFRIAGVIRLESALRLTEPYITIAGQTAPGSGITLVNERLIVSTHNVVIRYLRWRGGSDSFLTLRPWDDLHDVIIDHCSASWGEDDIVDIWYHADNTSPPEMRNITVQNCLIAEPLADHPTGMMVGATRTEDRDQITNVHHVSIHNNLFVHSSHRNPLINAIYVRVINNVVFNWHNRVGGSERASVVDWIGNYFKAGPMSNTTGTGNLRHMSVDYYNWDIAYAPASLYISGNIALNQGPPEADADNWWMITEHSGPNEGDVVSSANSRYSPLDPALFPVTAQSPVDAYDNIVSDVGANARLSSLGEWVSNRDHVDRRLVSDVENGTGPSHYSQVDVPGDIGPIDPGAPYDDSDHDGMPDEWELLYCFDANDPSDGPGDADEDGYTNVEEFLNGTQPTTGGSC